MKYTIKKGRRYHSNLLARILFFFVFKNSIHRVVRFDTKCWYPWKNSDSNDWNKLFGFSGWNHHNNSTRFVWRPYFHKVNFIEIGISEYIDGDRSIRYLGKARCAEPFRLQIIKNKSCIDYYMNGKYEGLTPLHGISKFRTWRFLNPYFGGDNRSPKTMNIYLTKRNEGIA